MTVEQRLTILSTVVTECKRTSYRKVISYLTGLWVRHFEEVSGDAAVTRGQGHLVYNVSVVCRFGNVTARGGFTPRSVCCSTLIPWKRCMINGHASCTSVWSTSHVTSCVAACPCQCPTDAMSSQPCWVINKPDWPFDCSQKNVMRLSLTAR